MPTSAAPGQNWPKRTPPSDSTGRIGLESYTCKLGADDVGDQEADVSDDQVGCGGDRGVDDHMGTSGWSGIKSDYTIVFYGIRIVRNDPKIVGNGRLVGELGGDE